MKPEGYVTRDEYESLQRKFDNAQFEIKQLSASSQEKDNQIYRLQKEIQRKEATIDEMHS